MDRVSSELRQHQAAQDLADRARVDPDFSDVEDLADLVGSGLRESIAALFATRDEVRVCQNSFGADVVNYRKALEGFMADMQALERALRHQWEQS